MVFWLQKLLQEGPSTLTLSIISSVHCVLCARHCAKWFPHISALNFHSALSHLLLCLFHKLENWGSMRLSGLLKIKQQVSDRAEIQIQLVNSPHSWPLSVPLPQPWRVKASQGPWEPMFLWKGYILWKERANDNTLIVKNQKLQEI